MFALVLPCHPNNSIIIHSRQSSAISKFIGGCYCCWCWCCYGFFPRARARKTDGAQVERSVRAGARTHARSQPEHQRAIAPAFATCCRVRHRRTIGVSRLAFEWPVIKMCAKRPGLAQAHGANRMLNVHFLCAVPFRVIKMHRCTDIVLFIINYLRFIGKY